jgi:hypothetical protein
MTLMMAERAMELSEVLCLKGYVEIQVEARRKWQVSRTGAERT